MLRGLIKNSQTEVFKDGREFLGLRNGFSPFIKQTRATFSFNVNKRLLFHKTQILTYFLHFFNVYYISGLFRVCLAFDVKRKKFICFQSPIFCWIY